MNKYEKDLKRAKKNARNAARSTKRGGWDVAGNAAWSGARCTRRNAWNAVRDVMSAAVWSVRKAAGYGKEEELELEVQIQLTLKELP